MLCEGGQRRCTRGLHGLSARISGHRILWRERVACSKKSYTVAVPGATFLPSFKMSERVIEIEPKQTRVLPNHGGREDVKHVIVGLPWDLLPMVGEQTPEVALPRIGRHAPDEADNAVFAPVVGCHHQKS